MTAKQLSRIHKLKTQSEKAARVIKRNQFLIDTLISLDEARRGKVNRYKSARELFKKLSI